MKDVWRCPKCRRRHQKTYTYGAVRGQSGDMVARELHHPDVTCDCGAAFPGYEIVGGAYDPPPVTISPLLRCLAAASANGLFWGGITCFFASATTSLIVGLGFFAACWLLFFTGQIEAFRAD